MDLVLVNKHLSTSPNGDGEQILFAIQIHFDDC